MRKATMLMLTVIAAAGFSTTAFAAQSKSQQVQRTQPTYNDCYQLALRRGYSPSKMDYVAVQHFIILCQAGKVPF